MKDIIYASATQLARAIRERKISAMEVVQAHLDRIKQVNGVLNAVVQTCSDRALLEARAADDALAKGIAVGPLHGVPLTLKDSLDTEGVISTGGTKGRASSKFPDRHRTTDLFTLKLSHASQTARAPCPLVLRRVIVAVWPRLPPEISLPRS